MTKPVMSDAEIRRRKKIQSVTSRTTSTLGLTGLATLGAGAALKRKPSMLRKIPKYAKATDDQIKGVGDHLGTKASHIGVVGAGIGGVGGFNFAAYTDAESKKRKQTVKKNDAPDVDMDAVYGEEGIAKNWSPTAKPHKPEVKRLKRNQLEQGAAGFVAGAAGVSAAAPLHEGLKYRGQAVEREAKGKSGAKARALSTPKLKRGGKLAAVAVGAAGTQQYIKHKRSSKSWEPYAKSAAASPFGIVHD